MKLRIGVIMYQTSRTKGQELVAQRMTSYFRRLGHEAYLITSLYNDGKETVTAESVGNRGFIQIDDAEFGIPIIRVVGFTSKWPPRRIVFKDLVHTLDKVVNTFQLNVLITHSTLWNGPEEVAKFVEWRRNIKELGGYQDALVFVHMSHFQEPSPGGYSLVERSFRLAWNRVSLRTILRVANLVLVVTPFEEKAKVKMGARKEKCVLFPGGVDDNAIASYASSNAGELLQRLNVTPETKIVTYVGTIEPRKNPMGVLKVAEKLRDRKDIHFIIAGRGDSQYASELKDKSQELANVTYLGELNEKEKVQLLQISYLNILLSKMEALGLSQLEFMYEGVPVVSSGVGGQSWVVKDKEDGVLVKGPNDIDGAASAVVDLVDNPTKRDEYSTNARKRASGFALSNLIQNLSQAITREIESESGLTALPSEVRSTLSKPELVVHNWTRGTQKIVATDQRLFIQQGRVSRKTLEVPYSSISSIEYSRRYAWTAVLLGAVLSFLMFTQHYISPIIARSLTMRILSKALDLAPRLSIVLPEILEYVWVIPILAAILLFLIRARKGYALHGAKLDPVYLQPSFREAIEFIRERQTLPETKKSADTLTDTSAFKPTTPPPDSLPET